MNNVIQPSKMEERMSCEEVYRPVSAKLRAEWLKLGKAKKASYLVIVVSDTFPLDFRPKFVELKEDLFKTIKAYHTSGNCNVVEVYSLNYPLAVQVDQMLFTDLNLPVYKQISQHYYYSEWQQEIANRESLTDVNYLPSQFDLESWFDRGLHYGNHYLVIVCQESVYPEYYPIYADKVNLFDSIVLHQHRKFCSVCEVYNLHYDFKAQYMNRLYSIFPKPEQFYTARKEKLQIFCQDPYLDGLRRRIWEYVIESSLSKYARSTNCYNAAYELMHYCSESDAEHTEMMLSMVLKAMELFPLENQSMESLQPFLLVYNNHYNHKWVAHSAGLNMRDFNILSREFSLACMYFASENINCDIWLNIIPDFISGGYDIRIPLAIFWKQRGCKKDKTAQVKEWLSNPYLSADDKQLLKNSLARDYDPKPFQAYRLWHKVYTEAYYVCGQIEDLFKHNDPDPVLSDPDELRETVSRAEAGDTISQVILGAAYLYDIQVKANRDEALKWLHRAAKAEHPSAYLLLGDAYIRSSEPGFDPARAMAYYKKAADLGYAQAYYNLAQQYRLGVYARKSYIKALAYYSAADELLQDIDNTLEDKMDIVLSEMSQASVSKAQKLAKELIRKSRQPEYEPLKYMYYFNPKGPHLFWHRRFWR